ncbi:glycosyltransferase family 9 protein [Patescibacteria group bacterium]|nr:glycosyltransferase family 9 protein [Patescibacteria group bacterium]
MRLRKKDFPKKIGIFHFAGLGDWLLLAPALKAIRNRFPGAKIYVYGYRQLDYFLKNSKLVDGYSLYPDYSVFKKNFRYDDKIFMSTFSGFFRITHCRQHVVALTGKIFNVDCSRISPELPLTYRDEKFGREFAQRCKDRLITLSAFTSQRMKEWDKKRWEKVIRHYRDYVFVQIGHKTGANNRIQGTVDLLEKTTLPQAISLVKYSRLFVGSEGLFNHIAQVCGTPKIVLWGAGSPLNFGYTHNTLNIYKKISCSPCYLQPYQKCRRQSGFFKNTAKCMSAISVAEVIDAIKTMLESPFDREMTFSDRFAISRNLCAACNHKEKCALDFFSVRFSDLFVFQAI